MIKDNQKMFNRMHVVLDAIIIVIAYALAWIFEIPQSSAGFVFRE